MKALTVELFLGVLALAAVDGCTARKAEPEPAPVAPAAPPPTPANEPMPLATAPAKEKPLAQQPLVDAGVENRPKSAPKAGSQAACGAGGCNADMKKGTK